MNDLRKDHQLTTIEEMTARMYSLRKRVEKEESKDQNKLKSWDAHCKKIATWNARVDALHIRRAKLIRAERAAQQQPAQA